MKEANFSVRMLTGAAGMMCVSGLLMVVGSRTVYGGILLASAACMFLASRFFRIAEGAYREENTNI